MKKSDRRFTSLNNEEEENKTLFNKMENKKRGTTSRTQYHKMLSGKNVNNKNYHEFSEEARVLTYENTVAHIPLEKLVLYNIGGTREEVIKEHFGDLAPDWFISSELKSCSGYYDDLKQDYVWRPIEFASNLPNLNIYYTVVNRIDFAQELIDRCNDKTVTTLLCEVQDKYQLLALHMELKSSYFDNQLETFDINTTDEENMVTPVELYDTKKPSFCREELPDIRKYAPYISFWKEDEELPTDNLLINRFMFLLFKALPYPYKRRSIENAIVESWSDIMQRIFLKNADKTENEKNRMKYERTFTSDIYQITIRIMLASFLGVYDHCNQKTDFQTRMKIYKWFCFNRPDEEKFSLWILKYKEVVLGCYREFLFDTIDYCGGVIDFLGNTSHWNVLKHLTYETLDGMRLQFCNSIGRYAVDYSISSLMGDGMWFELNSLCSGMESQFGADKSIFNSPISFSWYPKISWLYKVQKEFDTCNKKILKSTNRPKTDPFCTMVIDKIAEVDSKMRKTSCINPESIDPDYLNDSVKKHIREVVDASDMYDLMPFQFLGEHPVNLDVNILLDMEEAEEMYEFEEGSVQLKRVLTKLYREMPYEYQIFRYFFSELCRKREFQVFHLTKSIFKKQIETLKDVYETLPGTKLDNSAGLYYICTNCNTIKISVRDVSSHNSYNSIGGWSSDGVCICLDEEKFVCSYLNAKDTPKKRDPTKSIIRNTLSGKDSGLDSGLLSVRRLMDVNDIKSLRPLTEGKERATLDKYIEKRQKEEDCMKTELIPIYLPGYQIKLRDRKVIMCPQCAHPVCYSREMYRNGLQEMSCGCNDKGSEVEFKCFVCRMDCHKYTFIRPIWDNEEMIYSPRDDINPFKVICLCEEHKNTWVKEIDEIPCAMELETFARKQKVRRQTKQALEDKIMEYGEGRGVDSIWIDPLEKQNIIKRRKKYVQEAENKENIEMKSGEQLLITDGKTEYIDSTKPKHIEHKKDRIVKPKYGKRGRPRKHPIEPPKSNNHTVAASSDIVKEPEKVAKKEKVKKEKPLLKKQKISDDKQEEKQPEIELIPLGRKNKRQATTESENDNMKRQKPNPIPQKQKEFINPMFDDIDTIEQEHVTGDQVDRVVRKIRQKKILDKTTTQSSINDKFRKLKTRSRNFKPVYDMTKSALL